MKFYNQPVAELLLVDSTDVIATSLLLDVAGNETPDIDFDLDF